MSQQWIVADEGVLGRALPELAEIDAVLDRYVRLFDGALNGLYGPIRWGDQLTAEFKSSIDPQVAVLQALLEAIKALKARRTVDTKMMNELQKAAEEYTTQTAAQFSGSVPHR